MAEMSIKDKEIKSLKYKLNEKESKLVTLKEVVDLKDVMVQKTQKDKEQLQEEL